MPAHEKPAYATTVHCTCGASESITASTHYAIGQAVGAFRREHADCRGMERLGNPYLAQYVTTEGAY